MKVKKRVLIIILCFLIIAILIVCGILLDRSVTRYTRPVAKIVKTQTQQEDTNEPTTHELDPGLSDIQSVAILNLDEEQNCDSIVLYGIDKTSKNLNISSIPDDVAIKNAYVQDGANGVLSVLNENFSTNLQDYILIDIYKFSGLIDSLGGITINLSEADAKAINPSFSAGENKLNGTEILAYLKNTDKNKTECRQEILYSLFQEFSHASFLNQLTGGLEFMGNVDTSLSYSEILNFIEDDVFHYRMVEK